MDSRLERLRDQQKKLDVNLEITRRLINEITNGLTPEEFIAAKEDELRKLEKRRKRLEQEWNEKYGHLFEDV
jgi:HAMP domain-containing protein